MRRTRFGLCAMALMACGWLEPPQQPPQVPPDGRGQAAVGEGQPQGRGQRGRGARPRKVVLAWADTRNGQAQHDSVSHALAVIERLGYESGAYDTFIRTDSNIVSKKPLKTTGEAASGGPSLANVDAIFFMGHRDVPLDDAQKAELLVVRARRRKGFVAAHVGLTAFESWPEFGELLGARFDGHPINGPGVGHQRGSRISRDAASSGDVPIHRRVLPAEGLLARQDPRAPSPRPVERAGQSRTCISPNGDHPLAPGRRCTARAACSTDRSRIRPRTWDIRDVQQLYLEAIKWSLGLTDADLKPHPMMSSSSGAPAR